MTDRIVKISTIKFNFTPFALANTSVNLFDMVESFSGKGTPILRYLIYCMSIELGLKSIVLGINNSVEIKKFLKYKFGHDLVKIYNFSKKIADFRLSQDEVNTITKINPYYMSKGLEYYTIDVITSLANGLSDFPDVGSLKLICLKIKSYLILNKFYNN